MVGNFLEMTLIPDIDLRTATIPIFFDMMQDAVIVLQQQSWAHCLVWTVWMVVREVATTRPTSGRLRLRSLMEGAKVMWCTRISSIASLAHGTERAGHYKIVYCQPAGNFCDKLIVGQWANLKEMRGRWWSERRTSIKNLSVDCKCLNYNVMSYQVTLYLLSLFSDSTCLMFEPSDNIDQRHNSDVIMKHKKWSNNSQGVNSRQRGELKRVKRRRETTLLQSNDSTYMS